MKNSKNAPNDKKENRLGICLTICMVFVLMLCFSVFAGCKITEGNTENENQGNAQGSTTVDEDAKVLEIVGGKVDGMNISIEVFPEIVNFDLSTRLVVSQNCSWQLYQDISQQILVPSKCATNLSEGNNIYYIVVSSVDNKISRTYTLTILKDYYGIDLFDIKSLGTNDGYMIVGLKNRSIESIIIPGYVTSIGESAFSGCTSLKRITIPDSVTSIGHDAFYGCKIEEATIPALVIKYIDKSKLQSVVITSGDAIKEDAFYNCDSLTSVTIGDSVTSIGRHAFYGCRSLTNITIPDSVTSIGYDAFGDCTSLTSVVIGNSVTSIGESAFDGCDSLTSVTIPDSVTSIGQHAFGDCTSLTSITIPDSVTSIGDGAFYDCDSLTSVTIGDSVTSIDGWTFAGCNSLTNVTISESVTSIGKDAFIGCSSLTSVTIPDSVTSICESAFAGCSSLTCVTIPDSVTSIDQNAFDGCERLTAVYISDLEKWCNISFGSSPLYYGAKLYLNNELVTDLVIPDGVTSIDNAFRGCTSLTSVTIPDSVTSIWFDAFRGCEIEEANIPTMAIECIKTDKLKSVVITSGDAIKEDAFYICDSLTSVTIGDSVTSIGRYAFYGCRSLISVTIGDSVTSIGDSAFRSCALTSVTIPDSVTSIGYDAFGGCYHLVEVYNKSSLDIEKGETSYGSVGYYAKDIYTTEYESKLSTTDDGYIVYTNGNEKSLISYVGSENILTLPDGITEINSCAFRGCNSLTSVTIGDSVTSIGERAFYGCHSLTSVTIGDSVTSIGEYAFCDCYSLTSITIPNSVTSIGARIFHFCQAKLQIRCEAKSKPAGWSEVWNAREDGDYTNITWGCKPE